MKTLDERFTAMKTKLIEVLSEQQYVCVTTDVWSSRAQSYLGMTVHFLSPSYERISFVLAFRQLHDKQTFNILAAQMHNIFKEFQMPVNKITNVVTDGGSAFCKAFKVYGKKHDIIVENVTEDETNEPENEDQRANTNDQIPFMHTEDGELLFSNLLSFDSQETETSNSSSFDSIEDIGQNSNDSIDEIFGSSDERNDNQLDVIELPPQRRCLSHHLNLTSDDFEKALSGPVKTAYVAAVNKLHALWILTHRSSQAKSICKEELKRVFSIPCDTRWNSKYDAIVKSCSDAFKPKINFLIQRLKNEISSASILQPLCNNDWLILNEYLKVMKPVAVALDRLQGEKNTSQGFILPTLFAMKFHITSLEGGNALQVMKKAMLESIAKRYSVFFEINELNRDFILSAVSLPQFKTYFIENAIDERSARDLLKYECVQLAKENQTEPDANHFNEPNNDDAFFLSFSHNSRRNSIENDIEAEIARYLIDDRKDVAILNEFRNVKKVYYRYNTTLSASAAIERVFSQSLLIFRPRRNRLSSQNFERTLLYKHNRKILES